MSELARCSTPRRNGKKHVMPEDIDLRAHYRRGSGVTVWTLGHSHDPIETTLLRLREKSIERVIDVRSRPYVRRAPQYDRPALHASLVGHGFEYEWLGDKLGQRPRGSQFYDVEGYTLYEELLKESWFMKAIGLVEHQAERQRIALLCLEEQPRRCHRWALIGKLLADRGANVIHLRRDAPEQSQQEVDYVAGLAQQSLFGDPRPWRSPEPMWDMTSRRGPGEVDDEFSVDDSPDRT